MAEIKYVSLSKLGYYDEKIKKYITDSDNTLKTSLEGQLEVVAGALDGEIKRAKEAEGVNATAAATAQAKGEEALAHSEALAGKVGTVPSDKTVVEMIAEAKSEATYDDSELRGLITGLDTNKADKTQVAKDIADAVKVETDARVEAINGVQGSVNTLSQTHATDKAALEAAIALKADKTALDEVSGVANAAATKVALEAEVSRAQGEEARIEGLVTAEVAKAREEEGKLNTRLVAVETFFKTAEGETINDAMDTLVEIQKYITEDGAAADEMVKDIAANAKAIEDHMATDHDFGAADEALKAELNGEIAKKANTSVVEAIDDRLEVVEGKVSTLEDEVEALGEADEAQIERIAALEAKFGEGEGSVEDVVADAKQEAIAAAAADALEKANAAEANAKAHANGLNTAMDARVGALETASGTHALASDLTALAGRVTTAEGKVTTLEGKMTAVEALAAANKAAHEANAAAIALKASQADLNAVSGRVTTLETWHSNFLECSQEDINGLFD